MTETYDKENHWYGWNGGECPVHPETEVECVTANGVLFGVVPARVVSWTHLEAGAVNVIAFRIARFYREPKKPREWWILDFGTDADQRSFIAVTGLNAAEEADPFHRATLIHVREVLLEGDA